MLLQTSYEGENRHSDLEQRGILSGGPSVTSPSRKPVGHLALGFLFVRDELETVLTLPTLITQLRSDVFTFSAASHLLIT